MVCTLHVLHYGLRIIYSSFPGFQISWSGASISYSGSFTVIFSELNDTDLFVSFDAALIILLQTDSPIGLSVVTHHGSCPPNFLKADLVLSEEGRREVLTKFMICMRSKVYSCLVAGRRFLIASICIGNGTLILLMSSLTLKLTADH